MRALSWDGCVNVRDLGGIPTEDGAVDPLRQRRARGQPHRPECGGPEGAGRVRHHAHRRPPLGGGAARTARTTCRSRWSIVSLLGEREGPYATIHESLRGLTDPSTRRGSGYLEFVDVFAENIATAVTAVGQAPEGAVVVHCAGGVDRTGLVTALLLRLAGVGLDDIGLDYAQSEPNWAPHVGTWIAEAPDEEERDFRRMLSRCPPEAIVRPLEAVERRHGDVADVPAGRRSAGGSARRRAGARLRDG